MNKSPDTDNDVRDDKPEVLTAEITELENLFRRLTPARFPPGADEFLFAASRLIDDACIHPTRTPRAQRSWLGFVSGTLVGRTVTALVAALLFLSLRPQPDWRAAPSSVTAETTQVEEQSVAVDFGSSNSEPPVASIVASNHAEHREVAEYSELPPRAVPGGLPPSFDSALSVVSQRQWQRQSAESSVVSARDERSRPPIIPTMSYKQLARQLLLDELTSNATL